MIGMDLSSCCEADSTFERAADSACPNDGSSYLSIGGSFNPHNTLVNDCDLWKELRNELASSRAITSLAVNEVVNRFIADNSGKIQRKQEDIGGEQTSRVLCSSIRAQLGSGVGWNPDFSLCDNLNIMQRMLGGSGKKRRSSVGSHESSVKERLMDVLYKGKHLSQKTEETCLLSHARRISNNMLLTKEDKAMLQEIGEMLEAPSSKRGDVGGKMCAKKAKKSAMCCKDGFNGKNVTLHQLPKLLQRSQHSNSSQGSSLHELLHTASCLVSKDAKVTQQESRTKSLSAAQPLSDCFVPVELGKLDDGAMDTPSRTTIEDSGTVQGWDHNTDSLMVAFPDIPRQSLVSRIREGKDVLQEKNEMTKKVPSSLGESFSSFGTSRCSRNQGASQRSLLQSCKGSLGASSYRLELEPNDGVEDLIIEFPSNSRRLH